MTELDCHPAFKQWKNRLIKKSPSRRRSLTRVWIFSRGVCLAAAYVAHAFVPLFELAVPHAAEAVAL
jgi:hypothetical protein